MDQSRWPSGISPRPLGRHVVQFRDTAAAMGVRCHVARTLAAALAVGRRHQLAQPARGRPHPLAGRSPRPTRPRLTACPLRFAILASLAPIARSRAWTAPSQSHMGAQPKPAIRPHEPSQHRAHQHIPAVCVNVTNQPSPRRPESSNIVCSRVTTPPSPREPESKSTPWHPAPPNPISTMPISTVSSTGCNPVEDTHSGRVRKRHQSAQPP